MKKIFCLFLSVLMLLACMPLTSTVFAADDILTVYPQYDSRILRNYDYGVWVTQDNVTKELTVYNQNTTVEILSSRTNFTDKNRRFCEFAFSGSGVRVDIAVYSDFESYSVLPSAKEFRNSCTNGVISVWLDSPNEYFMIELDGEYNSILSVFADAPESYSFDKSDPSVLVIDGGWYEPENGVFTIPSGISTVYIAPGTVLCARVSVKKAGVTICGHGIVLDPWSNIFDRDITAQTLSHFFALNAANITVRDLKLLDSQTFNICLYGNASGGAISNVKIMSIRMCTDGISVFGANDVTVNHCFIYNGDNAIVFGDGNDNNIFNDCYLGTTCAAVFPQSALPGRVTLNNTYVFRCDQGVVNNWYNKTNPGTVSRTVAGVTFNNLSCVDVVNFPWLFSGRNMGTADKFFYFNNVQVPYSRGSAAITSKPNGKAIVLYGPSSSYMDTNNYHLAFENLTVDGSPVADASEIGAQIIYPDATYITATQNNPSSTVPTQKVNHSAYYEYAYKIYIGGSLQQMKTQPVMHNGKLMLPLEELCTKLQKAVPSDISGMVSLEEFSAKVAPVIYDAPNGKISVAYVCESSNNLLAENYEHLSRWNELTCYNSSLVTYTEDSKLIYKSTVSANDNHAGMVCMLTDEIQKCGPLKYRLTYTAKTADGTQMDGWFRLLLPNGGKTVSENIVYSGEWTDYSFELDLTATNTADSNYICLEFLSAANGAYKILFRDFSLTADSSLVTYMSGSEVFAHDSVSVGLAAIEPSEAPMLDGKAFDGWYKDEDCTQKYDFSLGISENTVLYAGFTDAVTVTLRCGETTQTTNVGRGRLLKLDNIPTYDGLYFAGWYKDKARTQPFDMSTPVTENISLYAGFYRNIYDYSVQDYSAYIANSTHALSSTEKVSDDGSANNRVTYCTVEPYKTYEIAINMDCRFRGGAVKSITSGDAIKNYFQHELDTNTAAYIGDIKTATITPGEDQTTLLIFYWTSSGSSDFLKTRQSIAVYDPLTIVTPPGNEEEPTEPTTEPPTEPTTEPPTESTTEPPTEPTTVPTTKPQSEKKQSFFDKIAAFFRMILEKIKSLFE